MKRKLIAFPGWSSNPYINMLCLAPRAAGWDVATPKTVPELVRAVKELARGDVLHVHWLAPVLAEAQNDREARASADKFCKLLDDATDRGVRLLWTVHNVVTHDSPRYAEEVKISTHLANRVEAILVLNETTSDITAPHYALPAEKVRLLTHSSYLGVYPQEVTRDEARSALGLDLDANVVGFVGQARPYKGIGMLLEAAGRMHSEGVPLTVVIAGKTPESEIDHLRSLVDKCPVEVRWLPRFVPESELQNWFRACDVMALPYARVLNSGSAYLSATFGVPCVLPDEPQFRSLFGDQDWVTMFDRDAAPASLAAALSANLPHRREAVAAAEEFARARTPFEMSLEYLSLIDR